MSVVSCQKDVKNVRIFLLYNIQSKFYSMNRLFTAFVAESTDPSLFASTLTIGHARSISTRPLTLYRRLLSIIDFAMVATKAMWAPALIDVYAFTIIHARDEAFSYTWEIFQC